MHKMTINAPIIREMSLLMLISATNAVMILLFIKLWDDDKNARKKIILIISMVRKMIMVPGMDYKIDRFCPRRRQFFL